MRGISVSDFGIGTDSPIGIYQDGVYTGKTGGALTIFDDVQRIEVLKGPQGTLFGRNSAAGAISVTTNEPTDSWEESARVRLGSYDMTYFDGVLNAPLTQDLAFRLSVVDNQSDGWLHDSATGQHYNKNDDWGMRAQFHWNGPRRYGSQPGVGTRGTRSAFAPRRSASCPWPPIPAPRSFRPTRTRIWTRSTCPCSTTRSVRAKRAISMA